MIELAPAASPKASVIVVGLRDAPTLIDCLASLEESVRDVSYEVLVVLNDPTPGLSWRLEQQVRGATVMSFRANLGFGGACNYAATRARGDYLVFLNDDCIVTRGWLEELIDTERRRERCGLVAGTFLHPDGSLQEAGSVVWNDGWTRAVGDGEKQGYMGFERRVDYASGGSLLVRRDVWDCLGGFDAAYYPAYFEDVDLCLRAAELGWEAWYQPRSVVVHSRSSSTGESIRRFLFEKARATFIERWGSVLSEREPSGATERAVWKAMGSPIRLLVIDDQLPDPTVGSGMGRMSEVLSVLDRDSTIAVAFHPRMASNSASACSISPGVRIVSDLASHLGTDGVCYDVVVVSRPHNAEIYKSLIDEQLAGAVVVYDAEALFYRRFEMQAELAGPDDEARLVAEAAEMEKTESSLAIWADAVVCISEEEAAKVRQVTSSPVHVVGPWFEAPLATTAGFDERSDVGLVAGWAAGRGAPNSDGLLWFAYEVLPKLRSLLPGCRLHVTGYNPPADVSWLGGPAVEFVGGIRDLRSFYEGIRVAISPTRFGAGVKLKTVEALQYGVPTVCTTEAAVGLSPELRQAVLVSDDPVEFAEAVFSLLKDRLTWDHYRQRALAAYEGSEVADSGIGQWPAIVREATRTARTKAFR